ncbi:MAG: NAD(P)-binding domain-containing protein [Pikeienuella sp.]
MNIGFIGTGEIAAAMVHGLERKGHAIFVSERNVHVAADLAADVDGLTVCDNQKVLDKSDVVFLCLMADVAREVLPGLTFRDDHRLISAMVDVDLAALGTLCAPATEIAITIPMPFIAKGGCPLPVFPESPALREVFGEDNQIILLAEEAAMNPHFAASALSSALFSMLDTGADWLGQHTGDAQSAEAYVASLFAGYFRHLPTDGAGRFGEVIASLSTTGGLNSTLREHLKREGAYDALLSGLDGFEERLGLHPRL